MILIHLPKTVTNFAIQLLVCTIFTVLVLSSCNRIKELLLEPVSEIIIDVPEPSGLCFGESNNFIYVVSDNSGYIYKLNLKGEIVNQFFFEDRDIEGITFDYSDSTLWLVDETNRLMINIDTTGNLINTINIEGNNELNNGLEGIGYNPGTNTFYIINEKNPSQLLIINNSNIISTINLSFADDLSGIFYHSTENKLYILSDKSQLIAKCNLEGKVESTYKFNEIDLEGIAVSDNKIYLVSDSENILYIYNKQ